MIESLKALEEYLIQNNMKKTLQALRADLLKQIPTKPSLQFHSLFQQNNQKENIDHQNQSLPVNISAHTKKPPLLSTTNQKQKKLIQRQRTRHTSHLPVQGLLGNIAYSQKLLQDNQMTEKINHLMGNKVFMKLFTDMFPEQGRQGQKHNKKRSANYQQKNCGNLNQNNTQSVYQYQDELDMVVDTLTKQQHSLGYSNGQQHENSSLSLAYEQESRQHQISAIEISQNSHINNSGASGLDVNALDEDSIISQQNQILEQFYKVDDQEEYTDDRDYGYEEHVFDQESLMAGCQQLSKIYNYPHSAVLKQSKKNENSFNKFKQSIELSQKIKFPKGMVFPSDQDPIYPLEFNGISYDVMSLKVIYDRERIGYEEEKEFQLKKGDIIAGRYQVQKILGSGVFAKVIKAKDLSSDNQDLTCFKMIQNDKDFLDQALDELKLLRYIKANCDPNKHYLLNFKQVFYHRQHLFIETDLLKDNLLTAFQNNPSFFCVQVIKKIAIQLLQALGTLHQMNIIHADLKPENIMVKTYNPIQVRVIDLGNGSFTHDQNLSNYVQSRSYRAPEVVLGCGYNEKIDIWSLGCILAQLWTKNVLFFNHHIQGMIARIQSIVGPWPQWMLQNGENVVNLFSNENFIYHHDKEKQLYHIFIPKKTTLKNRIRCDDQLFIDFIRCLVEIDPLKRPSAMQAMQHPFLKV